MFTGYSYPPLSQVEVVRSQIRQAPLNKLHKDRLFYELDLLEPALWCDELAKADCIISALISELVCKSTAKRCSSHYGLILSQLRPAPVFLIANSGSGEAISGVGENGVGLLGQSKANFGVVGIGGTLAGDGVPGGSFTGGPGEATEPGGAGIFCSGGTGNQGGAGGLFIGADGNLAGGAGIVSRGGSGNLPGAGAVLAGSDGNPGGNGATAIGGNSIGDAGGRGILCRGGDSSGGPGGIGIQAIGGSGTPNGLAGRFDGDVEITGNLTKGGGGFRIDHPLDPANKYLNHFFVEASEMLNLYSGTVTLDIKGEAVVYLPSWFTALNEDIRYQLTPLGSPAPNLHVAAPVQNDHFRIAGGTPLGQVCWLISGVRHDPFAQKHRRPVEEEKPPKEQGTYLYPEAGTSAKKTGRGAD